MNQKMVHYVGHSECDVMNTYALQEAIEPSKLTFIDIISFRNKQPMYHKVLIP